MSVDGSIAGSAGQVLVLTVRNVEVRLRITVLLGQAEINDVDLIAALADAHEEVIGLNVAVNERLGVDVLDTRDELVGQQKDRLQRELAVAEVEEILQAGSKKIEHHGIVVTLSAEPANEGNSYAAGQRLVDASFILQLRVLGLDALELDSDLLPRDNISTEINVTERAGADLSADAVFITDTKILNDID